MKTTTWNVKKGINTINNTEGSKDGKTWKEWKGLQLWFFKKIVGVIVIESSFLLFVTFDIMFGRQYISQTRSSDLIHMHWVISQVP